EREYNVLQDVGHVRDLRDCFAPPSWAQAGFSGHRVAYLLRLRIPGERALDVGTGRQTTIGAMKALITGGAGYIGSTIATACLEAGVETVILDDLSTGRR